MDKDDRNIHAYRLEDYPEVENVDFPEEIYIAYAVCGKECGNREFIVDGQTQVCEYCGRQMLRTEVKNYVIAKTDEEDKR